MPSIIYAKEVGGNWQMFCASCSVPVDIVSGKVLAALSANYSPVLCMDCDGGADEVPSVLLGTSFPYTLTFEHASLPVDPFGEVMNDASGEKELEILRKIFADLISWEVKGE